MAVKTEDTFAWLTKKVEEKMKGLNWARQNNKPVWYEDEPMQIVLSLRPIDEEPPDYILETKDGEHLKVSLLNRKLLYYEKGTQKPNIDQEESDLLGEENIDVSSSSKLSTRMQDHISSLSNKKKTKKKIKKEPKLMNVPVGATAQQLLNNIDVENERTEDLMSEINLYFQFFGSNMFQKIENAAISELAQIGIATEKYDDCDPKNKVLRRKRKRSTEEEEISVSAPTTRAPPRKQRKKKIKLAEVKREKIEPAEMSPHIVTILNQKLSADQDFYLTFNCLNCHGIFTSVVEPGEIVQHLCTSAGNRKILHKVRPERGPCQIQALQVAVV
jgi:hypothetical protein